MLSGISIKGIVSCLPSETSLNSEIDWIPKELNSKLIEALGINKRHVAPHDSSLLYYAENACKTLFTKLDIDRSDIGFILLVTQTGDTKIPNTVISLQTALQLPEQTLALEINMGCSGFVQGVYTAQSLLQSSEKKYGLLVCGDISSKLLEPKDSGTIPLFSDGLSATLVEKTPAPNARYLFNNSATNSDAISLKKGDGRAYLKLDGHKILMLGLQSVVPDVKGFLENQEVGAEIDYYFFHQASRIINQAIIKKLGLSVDECPETLGEFGNTSSATIPLTMSTVKVLSEKSNRILLCGFGTGLSRATACLDLPPIEYMGIIKR